MKLQYKFALFIFLVGAASLAVLFFVYFQQLREYSLETNKVFYERLVKEFSHDTDERLEEDVHHAYTLTNAPIVKQSLIESNEQFSKLSVEERTKMIAVLNDRWMATKTVEDPFVQSYMSNPVAAFLVKQQNMFPETYGEIFLTNRYGSLVASTRKLTTLAHSQKYWWRESYSEGQGKVFFDDRGYDESAGGYVLGVVVPIKDGKDIIGILKCNIKMTMSYSQHFTEYTENNSGSIRLLRSGGQIVFEKGVEPLSKRIQLPIVDKMARQESGSYLMYSDGEERLVAISPVLVTLPASSYGFGGTFESVDHVKGNLGESWYIVFSIGAAEALSALSEEHRNILGICAILILLMAATSLVFGRIMTRPIKQLVAVTEQIGKGDFTVQAEQTSNDELGSLALAFNTMARNLSESTASREELEESQSLLQGAMDQSPVGIAIADAPDGALRYVNDAGLLIQGIARESIVNRVGIDQSVTLLDLDGSTLNKDEVPLTRAIMYGESSSREFIIRRAEGDDRNVHANAAPILGKDGKTQSAICVFSDITEEKQSKAKHLKLEDQLRQSQKIESLGRLAGGVAHDYNNMLSVIIGNVELAQIKVEPSAPVGDNLGQILQAANRSRDITRQLLAFARKQIINPKVLDLNSSVADMLKMLRSLLGENIDLAWRPKEDLWSVKMAPSQLDQVLANLCINARDAITDVGKMTIETDIVSFDEDYCKDHLGFVPGEYVMLAVSDDGCGMDKETLKNIFEPFFTTKQTGEGTGLGMATVYGIIKQSDGFINVYSELGKGSTFRIYVPRCEGEGVVVRETTASQIQKGQGETVLLVEDEAAIVKLATAMLEDLGYKVLAANSPTEALRVAEVHRGEIQLLLTDVVMPGMNGRDLAKQVQEMCPKIKTIYMSGYTANVIAHHGVLDEGINFIQKPFARSDLSLRIREALDSKS